VLQTDYTVDILNFNTNQSWKWTQMQVEAMYLVPEHFLNNMLVISTNFPIDFGECTSFRKPLSPMIGVCHVSVLSS